jgi:hypothetical protein
MRFHSVAIIVAASASLLSCRHDRMQRSLGEDSDIALEIFYNRALKNTNLAGTTPGPHVLARILESRIGNVYNTIDPARSILIYDCMVSTPSWCDQPQFEFPAMMTIAAKMAGKAADQLFNDFWDNARCKDKQLPPIGPQGTGLQLLAIANRMDMAALNSGMWSGAEMHFVYGPKPPMGAKAPPLTVIVEFQLEPFSRTDFQSLAKDWIKLQSSTSTHYAIDLTDRIRASRVPVCAAGCVPNVSKIAHINIRLNNNDGGDWHFTQFRLESGTSAFVVAPLDNQLKPSIDTASNEYLQIWNAAQASLTQGRSSFEVGSRFAADLADGSLPYPTTNDAKGAPSTLANPREDVRNLLALQECTGCHTVETLPASASDGFKFNHIPNRLANETTKPSEFLIGPAGKIRPDLVDLYAPKPGIVSTVSISYAVAAAGQTKTITRYFHDVARRSLFLAAVSLDVAMDHKQFDPTVFSTHSVE